MVNSYSHYNKSMRILAALVATCLPAVCASLALQDVTVIDVTASAARPHMTVIVQGDRITAIGPVSSTPIPKDVQIVSGRDRFLIPGLWDMDVHLWYQQNRPPEFSWPSGITEGSGYGQRLSAVGRLA